MPANNSYVYGTLTYLVDNGANVISISYHFMRSNNPLHDHHITKLLNYAHQKGTITLTTTGSRYDSDIPTIAKPTKSCGNTAVAGVSTFEENRNR